MQHSVTSSKAKEDIILDQNVDSMNGGNEAADMARRPAHAASAISPPQRPKLKLAVIANKALQW